MILIIEEVFNPPKEMLLGAFASTMIAIGFAMQDLLKNIFGGVMLLFERPFKVGDKIKVGNDYGEVVNIGLRATTIVTSDDSLVYIPNVQIVNNNISNSNSGELNCQVVTQIFLPMDVDINKARDLAIKSAQVSKYVYLNKPIVVLFTNEISEGKAYIKMRVKAYVMDIRYEFLLQSDITETILKEISNKKLTKNKL